MFPLNLGVRGHDLTAATAAELGHKITVLQLTHMQLAIKKSFPEAAPALDSISYGAANYLAAELKQAGVGISVLGCYVNLASRDEAVRQAALASFKHHIRLAPKIGAVFVASETGSVTEGYTTDNFTEEAYLRARDSVYQLAQFAADQNVTLAFEAGINHPIYSAQRLRRLLDDIQAPHVKVILDCANLMTADADQNYVVQEALDLLHEEIEVLHLKDFKVVDQKVQVAPLGTGELDLTPLLTFCKKDKPLTFALLEATTEEHLPFAIKTLHERYAQI